MKKLRGRKGFTLVELLCVLAVLVLVSAGMLTGVLLGVRSYAKSVSYSEAQVLLQTLKTSVSDELRYAGVVRQEAGRPIGFFSQRFGQTMVMITHNEEIAQLADRVVRVEDGRVVTR